MPTSPRVSVCLLTYEHAAWVGQAIEGVLAQEIDLELVIGVDESSDQTLNICLDYQRQHPDRIRVEPRRKEDKIYQAGRPTGRFNLQQTLLSCRAPYVAMLDGDDWWTDPEKLPRQVALMDAKPHLALCFHRAVRIDLQTGEHLSVYPRMRRDQELPPAALIPTNLVPQVSVMYRRAAMPQPLPDWFLHQSPIGDWAMHMMVLQNGSAGFLPRTMAAYRVGSGWWSTRKRRDLIRDTIATRELVLAHLGGPDPSGMRRAIDRRRLQLVKALAEDGSANEAWAELEHTSSGARWQPSADLAGALLALSSPTLSRRFGEVSASVRARVVKALSRS